VIKKKSVNEGHRLTYQNLSDHVTDLIWFEELALNLLIRSSKNAEQRIPIK
jgi:hypothetical protein